VVIRPDVQKALDKMKAVPNDIRPASPATRSHSTLAWLQLAPTGAAFAGDLPLFEQAGKLWRQGLLRDE
jgi:hypothetical protein